MSDPRAPSGGAAEQVHQDSAGLLYQDKPASYYQGANQRIVELVPTGGGLRILEVGCGSGLTGAALLASGKAAEHVGVELSASAAAEARTRLTNVVVGNVETMDLSVLGADYDVLILSEVLEHLMDPWTALSRLVGLLKSGGLLICSSPNVANRQLLGQLLQGRFEYEEVGVMDRTHLRWFTPATYAALARQAGIHVDQVGPLTPLRPKARLLDRLFRGRFQHLFYSQILLTGRKP